MTADAPGATPEERREVLARELENAQQAGWRVPTRHADRGDSWLDRAVPTDAHSRALVRVARAHRAEYLRVLAEERAVERAEAS